MSRQDQYSVTVEVTRGTEVRNLGVFDKMSGGAADSEETKYKPGGMADQISLGGYRTIENVTISRLYDLIRDSPHVPWLMNGVGIATVVVIKQSLDVNKNAFGTPLVYRGVLKSVTPPEVDSESTDAALFELEVSTAGTLS